MGCSLILCEIVKKMTYMLKNSQNKWSGMCIMTE